MAAETAVRPPPWRWVVFALIACFTSATFFLVYRWVGDTLSAKTIPGMAAYLLWVFVAVGVAGALGLLVCYACHRPMLQRFTSDASRHSGLVWAVAGTGVLITLTQLSILVSFNSCANPGYAHVIVNMNVLLVLLGAFLIFGLPVGLMSGIGVVVAVVGVSLVIVGQKKTTPRPT